MQRKIKGLVALLWISIPVSATPAQSIDRGSASEEPPQQAFIVEQMITREIFHNDGSGVRSREMRIKVLTPAGVQAYGQLAFPYNSDNEQLAIDYVRARKPNGTLVNTSIQNAPEASLQISPQDPVFTDFREKHVAVISLSPGDTLEAKYTVTVLHSLAENQFWLSYSFNKQVKVEDERLIVEVPIRRQVKIKSARPYSTEETATTRTYTWKGSNMPKGDSNNAEKESTPTAPDVQLSSFASWQDVAAWYQTLLTSRISLTPELKAKALELTAGAASPEEKARRLYYFVSQNIRYISLSFGLGRYQPHFAADVLHNGYGDCKDKHTLLATLLSAVGISSHAVLIHSQNDLDPDVPAPSQFDHVITAAEIGGKRVWLDSTLGVAPFGVLLAGLRGKQALLVAPDLSEPLVSTPLVPPVTSAETDEIEGTFNDEGTLDADFHDSFKGDLAVPLRLVFRQAPQSNWGKFVQAMSYAAGFAGDVSDVKVENLETPDLPLKLSYHYVRKSYFTPDAADAKIGRNTLPLPPPAPDASAISRLKKKDELIMGGPLHIDQKVTLHFKKQQNPVAPIAVSLSRDYANYTSTYAVKDDQLTAERSYTINVHSLPVTRQKDLQAFLEAVSQDFQQQVAVTLTQGSVELASGSDGDSLALNKAASARLDVDDYKGAEELALKALKADPKSLYAWNNLGRAYLGEGDKLEQAESAFRKQIEINPYDKYAYNNLGRTLLQLHRTDEAIAAFRKQIEIMPLDQYAHMNLGRALLSMKKYDEAIPELEKAVQIRPEDNSLKVSLAEAYKGSGKTDKMSALLATLPPLTANSVVGVAYDAPFKEDVAPDTALQTSREFLQKLNGSYPSNEVSNKGGATSTIVPLLWARMGWAYFRQDQLQNAERYLHSAWVMSQSAPVGLRLGELYEKEGRRELAIKTYAEAIAGDGSKQGLRESLVRLLGDQHKADTLAAKDRGDLSQNRTVWLTKKSSDSGSAQLLLVFSHSGVPEKVIFTGGKGALVDHYKAAIKAARFPIVYPDDTPQYIVRAAVIYCGSASGCSVVLMPPSSQVSMNLHSSSKQ